MKRILLWFFISFLFGCEPPKIDNKIACVTLGNTKLLIPTKYFLPGFPPTLVPSKGLDKDVGELLEIPLRDLGYQKTGTGYALDLTFLVTPLNVHHSQTGLPSMILEAWRGYGYYKDRIIEFDDMTQLYRVYTSEYRVSLEFFKSYPDGSMDYNDEWVAGCMVFSSEKKVKDLSNIVCDTIFLYKDVHIKMTFSGMYVDLIEEFKTKVRSVFKSWETETCEIN
jgi:hypothetical protein